MRKNKKSRKGINKGALNGRALLTERDVKEIRKILKDPKVTYQKIAKAYKVGISTIYRICKGHTWRHV